MSFAELNYDCFVKRKLVALSWILHRFDRRIYKQTDSSCALVVLVVFIILLIIQSISYFCIMSNLLRHKQRSPTSTYSSARYSSSSSSNIFAACEPLLLFVALFEQLWADLYESSTRRATSGNPSFRSRSRCEQSAIIGERVAGRLSRCSHLKWMFLCVWICDDCERWIDNLNSIHTGKQSTTKQTTLIAELLSAIHHQLLACLLRSVQFSPPKNYTSVSDTKINNNNSWPTLDGCITHKLHLRQSTTTEKTSLKSLSSWVA